MVAMHVRVCAESVSSPSPFIYASRPSLASRLGRQRRSCRAAVVADSVGGDGKLSETWKRMDDAADETSERPRERRRRGLA